jgi:peptidylprolyl isomerase
MKRIFLLLMFAAAAAVAQAQTQAPAKPATHTATAAKPVVHAASTTAAALPPGIPPAAGPVETAFALRYQDIKLGTGLEAEARKLVKVHYTGWLAADGRKFDSSYDHPSQPLTDKDGKYVRDDKGQIVMSGPPPITFPLGVGQVIPGFDQGFGGMKVGGKRRLFIPWQLAYGAAGRPGPDAAHPGIPAKADLIFDIELVDVTDMVMPQGHPSVRLNPSPSQQPQAAPAQSAPPQPAAQPAASQPATTQQPQ